MTSVYLVSIAFFFLVRVCHEAALPLLQKRAQSLGFTEEDIWLTLSWIREMAPILVHVNLTKMMPFFEKDTHYRNQFETSTSGGLLKPAVRERWERDLFGGCYDGATGFAGAGSKRLKFTVQQGAEIE